MVSRGDRNDAATQRIHVAFAAPLRSLREMIN
jgi:hypothetical protein